MGKKGNIIVLSLCEKGVFVCYLQKQLVIVLTAGLNVGRDAVLNKRTKEGIIVCKGLEKWVLSCNR